MARLATCRANFGFLRASEQLEQSQPVCGMPPSWTVPRTTTRGVGGGAANAAVARRRTEIRVLMDPYDTLAADAHRLSSPQRHGNPLRPRRRGSGGGRQPRVRLSGGGAAPADAHGERFAFRHE